MLEQEQVQEIHSELCELKAHCWDEHKQRDINPQIQIVYKSGRGWAVDENLIAAGMNSGMTVGALLDSLLNTMPKEMSHHLEAVYVGVDAYTNCYDTLDSAEAKGDLKEEFSTNPASTVKESIITTIASDDRCGGCDIQTVVQTYTIGDGGVLQWDDQMNLDEAATGGHVQDVLAKMFKRELL
jgi:hypothetical protein